MVSGNQQPNELQNRNIAILNHPNGAKIYLVATAHISKQSVNDVIETIESVSPALVVLEIDPQRMDRLIDSADKYGIQRYKNANTLQIVGLAISGELLTYASGLFYAVTGALMGTKPGGEFLAAVEAAQGVGACVVYADRSQSVTMRRLQWYTRQVTQQQQQWPAGSSPFPGSNGSGESFPPAPIRRRKHSRRRIDDDDGSDGGDGIVIIDDNDSIGTTAADTITTTSINNSNTWGLDDTDIATNDDDTSVSAMKTRLLRMMQEGGCPRPNAVLAAAQRLLVAGLDPKGTISTQDLVEVRSCGTTLVENFRKRALAGDDTWMKSLEEETVAGAKGAIGANRSRAAMRKVIVDERDLILARKLWEAGYEVGAQQSVVGVVGAGHVKGIEKYWDIAGTPAVEQRVNEYLAMPPGEGPPSAIGMAVTGGVLGYIAYKRPRAMGLFLGAVTLLTAPYLGFSVMTMKRFTGLAGKLAKASEQLEFGEGMDDGWMGEMMNSGGGGGSD